MKAPTYQEQWNKLTEAYIENKIDAGDPCACFVGNLLQGDMDWYRIVHWKNALPNIINADYVYRYYTDMELFDLEYLFMEEVDKDWQTTRYGSPEWGENLFIAFSKTLDLLKSIHRKKGEIIDSKPTFTKRKINNLCPTDSHH